MKGKDILREANEGIVEATKFNDREEVKFTMKNVLSASHSYLLEIHSRALACHSECLGMNAENSIAVCEDREPPYTQSDYYRIMAKWELVNEKGEVII